jgi:nicotinate phosphoribosyltransferase
VRLRDFQKAALESWVQEYRGDLGIALTDVVGMDAFLADFDLYFAKLFDGLRHDSGDPVVWGEKALAHYGKLRIDAHTKRLVFSDGLDIEGARAVPALRRPHAAGLRHRHQPQQRHGLATLHIVMKLTRVQWPAGGQAVGQPGQDLCDDQTFLAYRDGRMAFVRSPDGISIELLQAGTPLASAEPWASMPNTGTW